MGERDNRDARERQHKKPATDDWYLLLCKGTCHLSLLTRLCLLFKLRLSFSVCVVDDKVLFFVSSVISLSLPCVTQTWTEMACTPSRVSQALAIHASTQPSGTHLSSVMIQGEETTSEWATVNTQTIRNVPFFFILTVGICQDGFSVTVCKPYLHTKYVCVCVSTL